MSVQDTACGGKQAVYFKATETFVSLSTVTRCTTTELGLDFTTSLCPMAAKGAIYVVSTKDSRMV